MTLCRQRYMYSTTCQFFLRVSFFRPVFLRPVWNAGLVPANEFCRRLCRFGRLFKIFGAIFLHL